MARRVYHFGDFQLDLDARLLRRLNGRLVTLPVRVFDCVAWLIEHRDRAVGRDELIAVVWNRADISDNLLVQLIVRARKLLDEGNEAQSTIRTVHGFGYQWAAPVRLVEAGEIEEAVTTPHRSPLDLTTGPSAADDRQEAVPDRKHRRLRLGALALLVLLLLLALAGSAFFGQRPATPQPADTTVAPQAIPGVLAVLPVGGAAIADAQWAWLRLGLMDFIANRLSENGQTVTRSVDVVTLVRDEPDAERAAEKIVAATAVRYVLLSTVARAADGWVVHLQLRDRQGEMREVQASGAQAIDAAREAVDRLLDRIGRPVHVEASGDRPAIELLQRAEAAELSDRIDDARRILDSAPDALRQSPELRLRLAFLDLKRGQAEAAREGYRSLLAETTAESDPVLRARILNGLGSAEVYANQREPAEQHFIEAATLLANAHAPEELGRAHTRLGALMMMQGRFEAAQTHYARARIAFESAGDLRNLAVLDGDEGAVHFYLGQYAESEALSERAAQRFERLGAMSHLAMVRGNQINQALALLRPDRAARIARQAGSRFDALGVVPWRNEFNIKRARALLESGALAEGRQLLDSLEGDIQSNALGLLPMLRTLQAEDDFRAGYFSSALDRTRQAIAAFPESTGADWLREERVTAWQIETRALRMLDRNPEAAEEVRRFRAWADATGEAAIGIQARLVEAEQAWSEGQADRAIGLYDALIERLPREGGSPAGRAAVMISYGNLLIGRGYLDRAAVIVGQVAPFADQDFESALLVARYYQALGQRDAWQTALDRARGLAGERPVPVALIAAPDTAVPSIR